MTTLQTRIRVWVDRKAAFPSGKTLSKKDGLNQTGLAAEHEQMAKDVAK